jgi:hypothetical protein
MGYPGVHSAINCWPGPRWSATSRIAARCLRGSATRSGSTVQLSSFRTIERTCSRLLPSRPRSVSTAAQRQLAVKRACRSVVQRARRPQQRNADNSDKWNVFALPLAVTEDLELRNHPTLTTRGLMARRDQETVLDCRKKAVDGAPHRIWLFNPGHVPTLI